MAGSRGTRAGTGPGTAAGTQAADGERCAWFRDLRFDFPGREEGPFRYGVCLPAAPGAAAQVYKLQGALRTRVQ